MVSKTCWSRPQDFLNLKNSRLKHAFKASAKRFNTFSRCVGKREIFTSQKTYFLIRTSSSWERLQWRWFRDCLWFNILTWFIDYCSILILLIRIPADTNVFKTSSGRLKKVTMSCDQTRRRQDVLQRTSDLRRLEDVRFTSSWWRPL